MSFFFLIAGFLAFAQSAKKLNKQLLAEFASEQQKQDLAFAAFAQTRREFDSLKRVANEKMDLLSNEERRAVKSVEKTIKMVSQLEELGINPYAIIPKDDPDRKEFPRYRDFIRPVKEIMRTEVKFDKVSNRLYLEGLKRKEQNVMLTEKISEYRAHSKENAIHQENLESNKEKLLAFFQKMDSLSRYYNGVTDEFKIKGAKLENKLDALRADYIKKGPHGFSDAYKKVFYDAFPPPQEERIREVDITSEWADGPYDMVVEPPVEPKDQKEVYDYVEEPATFPGGSEALKIFISKNLRYPESMKEAGVQGKVYLKFIVSETGEISDVKIARGIPDCKECDTEAIRFVKSMPKWIPGKNNGKAVKSYFTLPVRFQLD
jgi:TonB family protein